MPSSTVENYLKHILLLSKGAQDLVSMGEIAQALAIVPGTATTMIKALAREGYVAHQPRQGVSLTSSGRTVALSVLRKHRLVETFLVNVLKMDWASVHAEAEKLEHAISDEVLDRLDALLGYPATDPHGDPIPSRKGKLNFQVYASLATCALKQPLRIVRITEQTTEFLQFADQNHLQPGSTLSVTNRNLTAGLAKIKTTGTRAQALSITAAGKILVEPVRR